VKACPTCGGPDLADGTTLVEVEPGGPDSFGRESFTMHWFVPGRAGTTERRAEYPGGPSREVVLCGHRGQCFSAVVAEHVERAKRSGERVIVERRAKR
jgi:hypothetical protein